MNSKFEMGPPADTEVEINPEFQSGIQMALMRLDGVLDGYSLLNGKELAQAFENYIEYMSDIVNWSGPFLDGILHVLMSVKSQANSDKTPKEIANEVKKLYTNVNTTVSYEDTDLTAKQNKERRTLLSAMVFQFHPDSPFVQKQSPEEIERRVHIFKTEVSHAFGVEAAESYRILKALEARYGVTKKQETREA